MEERQPRSWIYRSLPVSFTLLEPASARRCPGSTLQEEIGVPPELLGDVHTRSVRLDVLNLGFFDCIEHVLCPLLDERHEAAVSKGSVWTAEGEVVWKGWYADG